MLNSKMHNRVCANIPIQQQQQQAGGAIKATAGKAAHGVSEAFKKKPNPQDPQAQELVNSEVESASKEEQEAKDSETAPEDEGTNPYAAPTATE